MAGTGDEGGAVFRGDYLPDLVVRQIFALIGARDSLAASQTCRRWRWIGISTRNDLRQLRLSDFYSGLIVKRSYIEHPVFHCREDLGYLVFIQTKWAKKMLQWLYKLYPNISDLVFRNYIKRGSMEDTRNLVNFDNETDRPSRYKVFIINELMTEIGKLWSRLEMLDISGQIVDVRSLHQVAGWEMFRELRVSGCDLSYNMMRPKYLAADALTKTFWEFQLGALRMSNLDLKFDLKFSRMTSFKALGHKSLTTSWLKDLFGEAVDLSSLEIDCQYLDDDCVGLIGNLSKLRKLVLRNCQQVKNFTPIGNLADLHTLLIDFCGKVDEDQLRDIVSGSPKWRRLVLNEVPISVGNRFLRHVADHCNQFSCPLVVFELNTEKKDILKRNWNLSNVSRKGIKMVMQACPKLETFGLRSKKIDNRCLTKMASLCPRLQSLYLNDSAVKDDGIVRFFCAFSGRHESLQGGIGSLFIDVRGSRCTTDLLDRARSQFGDRLRIRI